MSKPAGEPAAEPAVEAGEEGAGGDLVAVDSGAELKEYEPAKIHGLVLNHKKNLQSKNNGIFKSKPPSHDHDPLNFDGLFTEIDSFNQGKNDDEKKTQIFAANITAQFSHSSKSDNIKGGTTITDHQISIKRTASSKESEEKFILTLFNEDNKKIEVILDFSASKDEAQFSLNQIIKKINEIKTKTDGSKPIKSPDNLLLKRDKETGNPITPRKPQFFLSVKKPSEIIKYKLDEDLAFSWYDVDTATKSATEKKIGSSGDLVIGETLINLEDHNNRYLSLEPKKGQEQKEDLGLPKDQVQADDNSAIFCSNQNFSPVESSVSLVLVTGKSDPNTTHLDEDNTITLESKLAKISEEKKKGEEFSPKKKDDRQSKIEEAAEKIKKFLRKTYISRKAGPHAQAITAKFTDPSTGRYIDPAQYEEYKQLLQSEYLEETQSTQQSKKKQQTLANALLETINPDSEYSKTLNEGNLLQGTKKLQTATEYQDFVAITSFEGSSGFSDLSQSVQLASLSGTKPLYNIAKISDFPEAGSAPIYCLTSLTQSETDQKLLNKTFLSEQEGNEFLEETKKENKEIYELCLQYEKSLTKLKAYQAFYQKKIIELQDKEDKSGEISNYIERLSKLEKIALGSNIPGKKSKYWQDADLKDKSSLQIAMAQTLMDPIGAYEDNLKITDEETKNSIKTILKQFNKSVIEEIARIEEISKTEKKIDIDLEKLSEEEIARAKIKAAKYCNQRMQERIEENLQKYSVLFTQVEELNESSAKELSKGAFYGHTTKQPQIQEFLQEPFPNSAFGCKQGITISRVKGDNNAVKIVFNNPQMDTAWIDLGNGCFAKVLVGNGTESKTFYEKGSTWRTKPTSRVLAKGEIIIDQSIYVKNSEGQFYPTGDVSANSINALKAEMGQGSFSFETVALKFQKLKIDAISIDENQHLNGRLIQFEGKKLESKKLQQSGKVPAKTLEHQHESKEVYEYCSHKLITTGTTPPPCFISFCKQTKAFERDEFGFKFYSDEKLETPFKFTDDNTRETLTESANKVKPEDIDQGNPVKKETDKKTYFFQINPEEQDEAKKVYVCIGEDNKFLRSNSELGFYSKSPNDKMKVKTDLGLAEKTQYEQIAKNALFKISKDKFLKAENALSEISKAKNALSEIYKGKSLDESDWRTRKMKEFTPNSGKLGGNGR